MIKFLRWMIGYIHFTFTGGFSEGFINGCFKNGYNIHNIRMEGTAVYAECPAKLYPHLRHIAKRNGGKLKITKKSGLVFLLAPLKKRPGLLIGGVICIAIISFLSGFIWNINIIGNERMTNEEILNFCEKSGLHEGTYWKSVDANCLQSLIMATFDDCAWVHINKNGTTATIEISETVTHPKTLSKKPANLKAAKDGIIVKATVYDGWAVAKKGDSVVKGDILISGVYESEAGKMNLFAHARGEYIAEVKEKINLNISRNQEYKSYTYEKIFKSINFFSLNIPLYWGNSNINDSDIVTKYDYVRLNGKKLPIGMVTKTVKPYIIQTKTLSDSELSSLAESEIKRQLEDDFSNCEIIKQKIDINLNADSALAKGYILCLENIGEEIKIVK